MKITSTKALETVTVKRPIVRRTEIGTKPKHSFDQSSTPMESYTPGNKAAISGETQKVWADIPDKNPDGTPVLEERKVEVDLRPRNPYARGAVGFGLGAAVGGVAGAVAAQMMGTDPLTGGAIGAAAVGGAAGFVAGYSVYGEKTKLVWDTHEIKDHKMAGYRELVGPGRKGTQDGYFHRFLADVESSVIGAYQTPRVVRYKGDVAPEEVELDPSLETPQEHIPQEPSKNLDVTVSYERERLRSRYLGSIPRDYWSYSYGSSGYTSCGINGCNDGSNAVYRNTPVYEPDGEPRVDAMTRRIKASPYSVPLFAAGGAALGGALGFGAGVLLSHLTGLPASLSAGLGAGVGGLAGGFAAGNYAAGDAVRLEWREVEIHEKKLVGYSESVSPHMTTRCETRTDSDGKSKTECTTYQDGWDHSFSPDVRYWEVGNYVAPVVVHYRKKDGEFQPAPEQLQAPG